MQARLEPTLMPAGALNGRTLATPERLQFTGSGSEYFRIWIVNLVLTLLTFGLYSPWAKVRRLQYFHRNTRLADARFDYHGDPIAILKGRLLALGLLMAYQFSLGITPILFGGVILLLLVLAPWMLRQSLRFRLRNTSYRGLRFGFRGGLRESAIVLLAWGALAMVTFYLTWPAFHQRLKRYQHQNARFGQAAFQFSASIGQFFKAYALVILLMAATVVGLVIMGAFAFGQMEQAAADDEVALAALGGVVMAMAVLFMAGALLIAPLWQARIQNLVWNHTQLEQHRFESRASEWALFLIHLGNFVLIVVTLGLYKPWADIRVARYRLEAVSLVPSGSLDEFMAQQEAEVAAMGEEALEVFDYDMGL